MSQIEDSYESREVSESKPPRNTAPARTTTSKMGYCDHCGKYTFLRDVWNRGVAVEFKWLCDRDYLLTRW